MKQDFMIQPIDFIFLNPNKQSDYRIVRNCETFFSSTNSILESNHAPEKWGNHRLITVSQQTTDSLSRLLVKLSLIVSWGQNKNNLIEILAQKL